MDLSTRDKNMIIFGAVFLAAFCLVQFVYLPVRDRVQGLEQASAAMDKAIADMKIMQAEFSALSSDMEKQSDALKKRSRNFSLFSFLDAQVRKSGVKQNVAYMKPFSRQMEKTGFQVSSVKVKLKEVYLKGLVDFLSRVETPASAVYITSLSLTRAGKQMDRLDAVLEAQTLVLTPKTASKKGAARQ